MDTAMYQRYGTSSRFDSGREEMSQRHLLYYLLREGFVGHARELLDNCMLQCGREDCDVEFLFWKGKSFTALGLWLGFQMRRR